MNMERTGENMNEENRDFTIQELYGMLMADESWEPDPQVRQATVTGLMITLSAY